MAHRETFPGGACCKPVELPPYKAPPLQGGQLRDHADIVQSEDLIRLLEDENEDDDEYDWFLARGHWGTRHSAERWRAV
jgi:hypothetical protein